MCWVTKLLNHNMLVSWRFSSYLNNYLFSGIIGLHDCREFREHVKDLSCVSKDFCRIVIVDNNPFSFILQPLNGIPCVPFSAGQHTDDQVTDDEHQSFSGSILRFSKIILIFSLFTHFSSWQLYFHFWSIFHSRKMSGLYCTKGFTCQNGSKSMGSLKLIRQCKSCCHPMELFWWRLKRLPCHNSLRRGALVHYLYSFRVPDKVESLFIWSCHIWIWENCNLA